MATETQTPTYTYEDYLTEWESQIDKPPQLTRAEFWATLEEFLSYKQQIGAACKTGDKLTVSELEEKRQPAAVALLL